MKPKKRILVTGCAGFIGFHLSIKLLNLSRFKVYGIDNLNSVYDSKLKASRLNELKKYEKFTFNKIDISNKKKLNENFKNNKYQIVINLAAQAGVRDSIHNPDPYINSNIICFYNILEVSKDFKIQHLLYASSSSVYGSQKKFPSKEEFNTDKPLSLYAATKKTNEILAYSYSHIHKLPTTGLRFFTVYGPYGRPDMAPLKFTYAITNKKKINLFNKGNHFRDFTFIEDVTESILKLINKIKKTLTPHQIINIGGGKTYPLKFFLKTLEKLIGKKTVITYEPMQKGDVHKTNADISKLKKIINFSETVSLESGLKSLTEWYKQFYK